MMKTIDFMRRHATPIALLLLLLFVAAAPYLIPENPDSAVFRSGTLGLILIATCFFPVRRALERHDMRDILFGVGFALVFALCLGLGSELVAYDGLLPGKGALIRRLAVPVMASPTLGLLASYLFAFSPCRQAKTEPACGCKKLSLSFWVYFAGLTIGYVLILLALFPGVISYDFEHEIRQFTSGVYEAAHPVFHTLLLGSIYALGESIFGSMTAGAALYSVFQLLVMAALYAWACTFMQRRVPRGAALAIWALFALFPVHGVLAVSTAKDPLFGSLCVVFCLLLWNMAENPAAMLQSRKRTAAFILTGVFMCLLRHNAIAAVAMGCLAALLLGKGVRSRAALLCLLTLISCLLLPKVFETAVGATKTPSSELMSVPCQQLMRTAEYAGVTEEEHDELESWFSDQTYRYRSHCADPAKGGNFTFSRYQQNPSAFWSMYLRYGVKYPRTYLEAFLENSVGVWNPDDRSHAHSLSTEETVYIYLNTTYPFDSERYPIQAKCLLKPLHKLIYAFTHHVRQEKQPILAQLFCPATYTFLLLLTVLRLRRDRRRAFALATLPLWGLWATVLFSAGVFVRYVYPIMAAAPLLLALAFFSENKPS